MTPRRFRARPSGEGEPLSFEQAVARLHGLLGRKVRVTRLEDGRARSQDEGTLAPGVPDAPGAPEAEDGRVTFRIAPGAHWFVLHPGIFTGAERQAPRTLRLDFGEITFVIEELDSPRVPPSPAA